MKSINVFVLVALFTKTFTLWSSRIKLEWSRLHDLNFKNHLKWKGYQGFFLRSRTSFFNTYAMNKHRVNAYFHIYCMVKIKNSFLCMCWRRNCSASLSAQPMRKKLKSFPFKVVLSWKLQCSCDVITERVYCASDCMLLHDFFLVLVLKRGAGSWWLARRE